MKKLILLASLGITVFSVAPYHTMAVPMSPGQTADSTGSVSQPSGVVLPPPPALVLLLPPPPSTILLPPPPEPVLITELPPPPSPAPSTAGVPETGATWFFLLSGLAATFVALTLQQRSSKKSRRDS
ncbi:MAG: hypothetical protein ACJ8M1_01645 [Chthoniobacterales bacterium]